MKKTKKLPRKSISKPKEAPQEDIARLMRQKEFWIGVATFVVLLFLGSSLVYSNLSKKTSIQVRQPIPTPSPKQEAKGTQIIPAIKKLANTSGYIQFFKKVTSPTPTPQPQTDSSSSPSSTSSNHSNSSAEPARGGVETAKQESRPTPEPTVFVNEDLATPAPTIYEEPVPTQPEAEPTPSNKPSEEHQKEPDQEEIDKNNQGKDLQVDHHEENHDENSHEQSSE